MTIPNVADYLTLTVYAIDDPTTHTQVSLPINPKEVGFSQPKIIQKVQTQTPNRFVIIDWGMDLMTLKISCQTGNLIPTAEELSAMGLSDPQQMRAAGVPTDAVDAVYALTNTRSGQVRLATQFLHQDLAYAASWRYQSLLLLESLYKAFNINEQVMELSLGAKYYRGYMDNYSYNRSSDKPWNIEYSFDFIVLEDLGALAANIESHRGQYIVSS